MVLLSDFIHEHPYWSFMGGSVVLVGLLTFGLKLLIDSETRSYNKKKEESIQNIMDDQKNRR